MVNIETIKAFIRSNNPSWSIAKILFVSWLILKILNRNKEEFSMNYKIIDKIGNKDIYFDDKSNTYGVIINNKVKIYNNLNDLKKSL